MSRKYLNQLWWEEKRRFKTDWTKTHITTVYPFKAILKNGSAGPGFIRILFLKRIVFYYKPAWIKFAQNQILLNPSLRTFDGIILLWKNWIGLKKISTDSNTFSKGWKIEDSRQYAEGLNKKLPKIKKRFKEKIKMSSVNK